MIKRRKLIFRNSLKDGPPMSQVALGYLLLATSFSRILAHLSFLFMISLVIMEGTHASLEFLHVLRLLPSVLL
jgi:hypothetical protein